MKKILAPYTKNGFSLKNRLVMAPMTRSRAIGNIPNALMAEYYSQRSGAGLIITEGTAPAPEALGYARIPGIFSQQQVDGWKATTTAVHAQNSKIFLQLMHTGRMGHVANLPAGIQLVSASSIKAAGQVHTDALGMQDYSEPVALSTQGVKDIINIHVTASENAIKARFDGIELHGANGYLIEQFLNPATNDRSDEYGGSIKGRSKIVVELCESITAAIGKDKVGIRFSPYNTLGDLEAYDDSDVHDTYAYLATELNRIGIAYIHIGTVSPKTSKTLEAIRSNFKNTIIICNGLTPQSAEAALQNNITDLVAFGRSFLANPDLDKRIANDTALNAPDFTTLYTPGAKGYTDYPALSEVNI